MLIAWYDIETDGLLDTVSVIHTLVISFSDGRFLSCADQPGYTPIDEGLRELAKADIRVGHNIIGYDEEVFRRLKGPVLPPDREIDTLILARLVFPEVHRHGPNPHKVFAKKSHRLEDWGRRLGELKGEYQGGWSAWNREMQDYCEQDVRVTKKLYQFLMHSARRPPSAAVSLEMAFARIIARQERRGVTFDMVKALEMQADLNQRLAEIETALIEKFGSWWGYKSRAPEASGRDGDDMDEDEIEEIAEEEALKRLEPVVKAVAKTSRVKMKEFPDVRHPRYSKAGKRLADYVGPPICTYEEGATYVEVRRVQFNPGSREHVRMILKDRYGWVPTRWTAPTKRNPQGSPIVDDGVLQDLADRIPEARSIADYYLIKKRLGMIADGRQGWIKKAVLCQATGEYRIHGRVNTGGALGGRCTHSSPNLAQAPSKKKEYVGTPEELAKKESLKVLAGIPPARVLFIPRKGYAQVGFDASALELCMLGDRLALYDGGTYAAIVSDPAGDPHAWTRDTIGTEIMGPGKDGREKSKTTIYAKIYGGGKEKVGSIINPKANQQEKIALGQRVDEAIMSRFSALSDLQADLTELVDAEGSIRGIDGRVIPIRKRFAALNTLLQSQGALVMKMALVILDNALKKAGLLFGRDYEFILNIHDEVQAEVLPEALDKFVPLAKDCVRRAGEAFKLRCPLRGEVIVGKNWYECH